MCAACFKAKAIEWILSKSGGITAKSVSSSAPILYGIQEAIDVKGILQLASDQIKTGSRGDKVTASFGFQNQLRSISLLKII